MTLEEAIQSALKKRQDRIIEAMINGVQSYDQYQHLVGQIQGMTYLMEDIQPLLRDPDDEEGR